LPVGRLRDLPIWSKLGLIMIVPTIATIVVGTAGLVDNISNANAADRARTLSDLTANAGALVHEIQDERAAATLLLGTSGNTEARTAFDRDTAKTDDAARAYTRRRSALADLPADLKQRLSRIDTQLSDLPIMRKQIITPGAIPGSLVIGRYQTLVEDLISIRDSTAELAGNSHLGADIRAAAAISTEKEFLSLERVVVLQALNAGQLSPELRTAFNDAIIGQRQAHDRFNIAAAQWMTDQYSQTVTGSDLREAFKFEGIISATPGEKLPDGIFTPTQWDSAMVGKANLVRKVEVDLDEHNVEDATAERDVLQRTVLIQAGVLLGMLLLAILFAWVVARSMARSLRELRHGALTVAQYGLPQAVARLRDPSLSTQLSPQQVAMQIAEPLPVRSRDEFGQVAEAFNAVHLEAVRTAAEQAALRASVATMFVNLARRSQILVDRLIGHLDRLERGEEDPDRLAELFQLDHLATRMRRNDENLLVLAGADSTRIQREPAPLMDVLRAAQSEVEHYTRIEFGMIDRDIEIASHAVNDMVHLVAELLDNATAFSPPDSAVVVEARRVGDRSVLLVEDHGIGISPEQLAELNDRLANPPMVDVAVSRMMGLVVVARLAARHGVKVELRPARERGSVADVTLPSGVLVPRALAGRGAGGMPTAGMPSSPREAIPLRPTQVPRSPAGPPLALESGPALGRPGFGGDSRGGRPGADTGARPAYADNGGGFPGGGLGGFATPPAPSAPSVPPAGVPRGLPAWSDLTGVNGHDTRPARPAPGYSDPLPQRRSGDHWTLDGEVSSGEEPAGPIPRQRPFAPEARAAEAPPVVPSGPPVPPAWPPVGPTPASQPGGPPEPHGPVHSPPTERTAEMPRVRLDWEPAPPDTAGDYDGGDTRQRFVDETMELPIFREVESAWFRSHQGSPAEPVQPNGGNAPVEYAYPDYAAAPSMVTEPDEHHAVDYGPRVSTDRVTAAPSASWQTAADEGWQAAAALADEQDFAVTDTGLPRRVPMSQLVPGGVEKTTSAAHRRTPESVRGLLSAYHRGVQRGRSQQPTAGDPKTPEPTTAGPQNPQGGKEQEA
jgi:signal transduction histidine kinase